MGNIDGTQSEQTGDPDDAGTRPVSRQMSGEVLPVAAPAARSKVNVSGAHGVQVGDRASQINIYLDLPAEGGDHPAGDDRPGLGVQAGCSPYPGMAAFQVADAPFFHGREQLTQELRERVEGLHAAGGVLFVVGPSGSGKSSLLRAGLVPALGEGGPQLRLAWPVGDQLVLAPGPQPVETLATCVANLAGLTAPEVRNSVVAEPEGFGLLVRQALQARPAASVIGGDADGHDAPGRWPPDPVGTDPASRRLVLVVDQFEEIFAPHVDEETRAVFVRALVSAAAPRIDRSTLGPARADCDAAAVVVVGLRADFLAWCLGDPLLGPYLQDRLFLVGPMCPDEVRAAIERPAADAGLRLEQGLVEVMLADLRLHPATGAGQAAGEPGQVAGLPFLAHALRETCDRRDADGTLTIAGYRAAGGVHGSVAASAERLYTSLDDPPRRQILQQVMLRLVAVADDTPPTRRHVTRRELVPEHDPSRASLVVEVLDQLVASRLVTADDDWVEISHEALIGGWSRLTDWLEEDRQGLYVHRQLTEAAAQWDRLDHDEGSLYRGARLAAARDWARQPEHHNALNDLEHLFLDTSRQSDEQRTRAETERARDEADRARAQARRTRILAIALAILLVAALAATGAAVTYAKRANQQHTFSVSRQLAAQSQALAPSDPDLALLLATQASRYAPTQEAR